MNDTFNTLEDERNERQRAEREGLELEHEAAMEQWTDDLMIYAADVVSQHAKDWVMYALAIRDGDPNPQEPVLPPAPTHPDLLPPAPVDLNEEVPT